MSREPNDAGGDADRYTDDHDDTVRETDPDEWQDRRYSGSLIEDAAAVVELGKSLAAKMAEPAPENIFDRARRLNAEQSVQQQFSQVFGSLSAADEIREQLCSGPYSMAARGGKPF